jgi:hypothetical protein
MYTAKKLEPITQISKRGLILTEPPLTQWGIEYKDDDKHTIIAYIPDWFSNKEEIANGIAEILNKNRTIKFNI